MGVCWSGTIPDDDEKETGSRKEIVFSPSLLLASKTPRKAVEFGREEMNLNELLASLRTGLVFAPTTFPVLPGNIGTTAKVNYTIGSSELQRRQEKNMAEELVKDTLEKDPVEDSEEEEEEVEEKDHDKNSELKMTLRGRSWAKGLVMSLDITPALGPFQGRTLNYHWREDILGVTGCERGEIEAHTLPISFENEVEFCKCCLLLTYQNSHQHGQEEQFDGGEDEDELRTSSADSHIPSLTSYAYKTAVANLDILSSEAVATVPPKLLHILFGSQDPVDVTISLWPEALVQQEEARSLKMRVKSGILFAELNHLVREHFQFEPHQTIKLYKDYRPVNPGEIVTTKLSHLDCFVLSGYNNTTRGSFTSLGEEVYDNTETSLIVSLVGKQIRSVRVDSDMCMKDLDTLLRGKFELKTDSFLIILAEDDLSPQYMADDNWKCTYPFSIPDHSFGAGLRRNFQRLSTRRRGGGGSIPHTSGYEADMSTFTPLMTEVIRLLSSDERQFPQNGTRVGGGLSVEELHRSMPMYQMSIEQCNIHPHSLIQIFEVTGPSIPITVQVLFDHDDGKDFQLHSHDARVAVRTRLANVMDINPDWSINTFLQYIDAVVSLSSSSRQKKLWLKENSVDSDKDDLSSLKLGELLDTWKPLWWAERGLKRRQLSEKDIDPSEYLIVEKF